jgi:hypothetical protein
MTNKSIYNRWQGITAWMIQAKPEHIQEIDSIHHHFADRLTRITTNNTEVQYNFGRFLLSASVQMSNASDLKKDTETREVTQKSTQPKTHHLITCERSSRTENTKLHSESQDQKRKNR